MSGEGMIANDPQFIRWEPAMDARTRHHDWSAFAPKMGWDLGYEPPQLLGWFNCRGEYVLRPLRRPPAAWPQDVTVPPPVMRGRIVIHQPPPPALPELPEGLWDRDGMVFFECRGCECAVQLECDPEEFDPEVAYCGGSPRCLP